MADINEDYNVDHEDAKSLIRFVFDCEDIDKLRMIMNLFRGINGVKTTTTDTVDAYRATIFAAIGTMTSIWNPARNYASVIRLACSIVVDNELQAQGQAQGQVHNRQDSGYPDLVTWLLKKIDDQQQELVYLNAISRKFIKELQDEISKATKTTTEAEKF